LRNLRCLGLFLLLPVVVGGHLPGDDSTSTNIKVAGGLGSYASIRRGCHGEVISKRKVGFEDFGFSWDHKLKSPLRVGLRAGGIWQGSGFRRNLYMNPNLSFEWTKFGFGAGPFLAQENLPSGNESWDRNSLSWHLRIGSPKSYTSLSMLECVPLYSGGGYINIGFGGMAGKKVSYWFGLGTSGPYDNPGFVAKTNLKLKADWSLDLATRLGRSEGISESAISIGLNYKLSRKPSLCH